MLLLPPHSYEKGGDRKTSVEHKHYARHTPKTFTLTLPPSGQFYEQNGLPIFSLHSLLLARKRKEHKLKKEKKEEDITVAGT